MTAEPSVGVVIPAYQAEQFLAEALDSVVAHDEVVDVVVVDDGSTDSTAAIASGYGPPVRVLRQANAGIGATRNHGAAAVRGTVLAFLDADDRWTPHGLRGRLELLAADDGPDVVFGQLRQFTTLTEDGEPQGAGELRPAHLPAAMLVRRRAFERVGPFAVGLAVSEGLDWMLRAQEAGLHIATVADHVLWRRVHGANNSLRHRAEIGEFAHTLKASLDRRRAADASSGP